MTPWVRLGSSQIPQSKDELQLWQRDKEFSIRVTGHDGDLMNSRMHHSEDQLARLACAEIADCLEPRMLIGGLGMGFTLRAALDALPARAAVKVAELVPAVVDWNSGALGACAGYPLRDPRVSVIVDDIARVLRSEKSALDAILLDVDNGPDALTLRANSWLYSLEGLAAARVSLRPRGVLAVWSVAADAAFTARLERSGFAARAVTVRARPGKGARHVVWVAQRGA